MLNKMRVEQVLRVKGGKEVSYCYLNESDISLLYISNTQFNQLNRFVISDTYVKSILSTATL